MSRVHAPLVAAVAMLAIAVLYAPQPLLPAMAESLGVGPARASALVSAALAPLAVAPWLYGVLLEGIPAGRVLRWAAAVLGLATVGAAVAVGYGTLLVSRVIQGLAVPALLTALMTEVAAGAAPRDVQRALAWYVAATVVGGFVGRAGSGLLAAWGGWRLPFAVLAACCGLSWWGTRRFGGGAAAFERIRFAALARLVRDAIARRVGALIFSAFFVFAAGLNFLPFRLLELAPGTGSGATGLAYVGYLAGAGMAVAAVRVRRWAGGDAPALGWGLGLMALAVVVMASPSVVGLVVGVVVLCAGMFLVHGLLPGLLHRWCGAHGRGVVNGFYVGCYYAGGSLGSLAPAPAVDRFGWAGCLALVAVALTCAFAAWWALRRALRSGTHRGRRGAPV